MAIQFYKIINLRFLGYLLSSLLVFPPTLASSDKRFSKLSLILNQYKKVDYKFDKPSLRLFIRIHNMHIDDLTSLDDYNEHFIRRTILKQKGDIAEVILVLKDPNTDYKINVFHDPYRLNIDFFDRNFEQAKDPNTGLPIESIGSEEIEKDKTEYTFLNPMHGYDAGELNQEKDPNEGFKYELLNPIAKEVFDQKQLKDTIEKIPSGIGRAWQEFPLYVYRLDTSSFTGRKKPEPGLRRNADNRFAQANELAQIAETLMGYGHEGRALHVYQQALHIDPRVFDHDALYLWNFSEAHLGQNNLVLADGYYQAVIEKHPNSTLAKYAKIRRADVQVLKAISNGVELSNEAKQNLLNHLSKIKFYQDYESRAQVMIRKGFWTYPINVNSSGLPVVDSQFVSEASQLLDKVENPKTAFILSSIILEYYTSKETPWTTESGDFAAEYFKQFSNASETDITSALKDQLKTKLSSEIEGNNVNSNHSKTIALFDSLPKSLKSIRKEPKTSWAIAESFRKAGNGQNAIKYYKISSKSSDQLHAIKSAFWASYLAKEATTLNPQGLGPDERRQLNKTAVDFDSQFTSLWNQASKESQDQVYKNLKPHFEDSLKYKFYLSTPANIVLSYWTKPLTQESTSKAELESEKQYTTPNAEKIILISRLAETFAKLRETTKRRQALKLLKSISPENIEDNQAAKSIWARDLINLAEEYRLANNYLEAGRTYKFTAENNAGWDKRAEALYKGGLLLYRAGKTSEAIDSLKQACNDGDNLFYKNLACERLDTLEN